MKTITGKAFGPHGWRVDRLVFINATEYVIGNDGGCFGSFGTPEQLRGFADMLSEDRRERRETLGEETAKAYGDLIAAIEDTLTQEAGEKSDTRRKLDTIRGAQARNDERIREWEARHG